MDSTLGSSVGDMRLDFSAPLLSVRRFASPLPPSRTAAAISSGAEEDGGREPGGEGWLRRCSLPFYKSDLKSGPVRNPGVVPFVWEQSPGRPKDGHSRHGDSPAKPVHPPPALLTPKTPPGGPLPVSPAAYSSPSTAATPSPSSRGATEKILLPTPSPPPPSSFSFLNGTALSKFLESSTREEDPKTKAKAKAKQEVEEAPVLAEERGDSDVDEDGDEDAFSDALDDALSRTESCFVNCSTSGLSGGFVGREPPSGGFSKDPQVREFMMGRFLPAAQAMMTRSPQRAARKPMVPGRDPGRRVLEDGGGNRQPARVPPPYHYQHRPDYAVFDAVGYHNVGFGGDDSYDNGEDGRNVDAGRSRGKGRGWLPRLCLRGSLCLLNPIPLMKLRNDDRTTSNCSDRNPFAGLQNQRIEGSIVLKAHKQHTSTPSKCPGSVVVHPAALCPVAGSQPAAQVVYAEEVSGKGDAPVDGSQPPPPVDEQGSSKKDSAGALEDLLPPALPKSPSESWLCQALPCVSSWKNTAPQSLFLGVPSHSKRQLIRASPADPGCRCEAMASSTSPLPKYQTRLVDVLSRPVNEE